MRMLAAPVNVLVDESAFVDGNALQHAFVDQQIQRAVNRGPRNALAAMMQAKVQIVRREVPVQRLDVVEDELPLARAARSGGRNAMRDT